MLEPRDGDEGEISLLEMGTMVLRGRWRVARWTVSLALVSAAVVLIQPPQFFASASFISQGNDPSRAGLSSLAGQFGVTLPTANASLSPDFYAKLLKSTMLLERVAADSFEVPELGITRVSFLDAFHIRKDAPAVRQQLGVTLLSKIVKTDVTKATGIVEVTVDTKWPSVSFGIINDLMRGLDEFNISSRQSQAGAERRFVEGRLAIADTSLRDAENRLEEFLRVNRVIASPNLVLERDRLQRAVTMRQQLYTTLAQSYEDVRMREVRDTPVITVVEAPAVRPMHEPRGITGYTALGAFIGVFLGTLLALVSGIAAHGSARGAVAQAEFATVVAEIRREFLAPLSWVGRRPAK